MDDIRIIKNPIGLEELRAMAKERFGDLVKAVADIKQGIMAIGGELHADEEAVLLDAGSAQSDLWGINLYVNQPRESWIEFDSMINIRPSRNNRSRNVEDEAIREKIRQIVNSLVQ